MLKKKIAKRGNSYAVVIDKPIREMLGVDERTSFVITTDGVRLILTPVVKEKRKR